jgi:hypothetical protein
LWESVRPQGADVFSYAPDENDLVQDPLLSEHLSHWGIDAMKMEKVRVRVRVVGVCACVRRRPVSPVCGCPPLSATSAGDEVAGAFLDDCLSKLATQLR